MREIDKFYPLKGFEKTHLISKNGELKSLDRLDSIGRKLKGKPIKQYTAKNGYKVITINGKTFYIHALMAKTFLTGNSETINHINGVKTDNRIDNLERASYSQNNKHAYKTGLKVKPFEYSLIAKKEVAAKVLKNVRECAYFLNVTESSVYRCVSGKRKTLKGFTLNKI